MIKIMMLGDSITDEGEWNELWGENCTKIEVSVEILHGVFRQTFIL